MAKLLYRLGRAAFDRAWLVLTSWIVILLAAGTLALTAGGQLSSSLSIDGVESQKVVDQLQQNFEEASRGSGRVVFYKTDGTAFTSADKEVIADALSEVEKVSGVADALNPFEIEKQISDSRQELQDGREQATTGRAELEKNEKDVNSGLEQLAKSK